MNSIPLQANVRTRPVVARADGSPITAGTVNYYLIANTGANAGKWFQTSDNSWQVAEAIAAVMTHKGDGHWTASVDAEAWPTADVEYTEYAKESGNLHVPTSAMTRCEVPGSLKAILNTALTETSAGYVAAAFKKFFDKATPTGTVNSLPDVVPDGAGGLPTTTKITDARLGVLTDWINGGRLDLILDIIAADTTTDIPTLIGVAGAGLTAIPWNATWDAEVESEVNDALVVLKLDHLVAVADADDPVNNSIIAKIASATSDWSTFVPLTDSLEGAHNYDVAAYTSVNNGQTQIVGYVDCLPVTLDGSSFTSIPKTGYSLASTGLDLVTTWTVDVTGSLSGSVGSVTTKTGYSLANGSIIAASFATGALSSDALSAAMANKIADHMRRRTQANVEASSDGDALDLLSQYGAIQQMQESSVSGTTMTVKKTDGTTTLGTRTLTSDADADPITGVS